MASAPASGSMGNQVGSAFNNCTCNPPGSVDDTTYNRAPVRQDDDDLTIEHMGGLGTKWPTHEIPQTTVLKNSIVLVRGYLKRLNKPDTPQANWVMRRVVESALSSHFNLANSIERVKLARINECAFVWPQVYRA